MVGIRFLGVTSYTAQAVLIASPKFNLNQRRVPGSVKHWHGGLNGCTKRCPLNAIN
jgi:hypothetical protein